MKLSTQQLHDLYGVIHNSALDVADFKFQLEGERAVITYYPEDGGIFDREDSGRTHRLVPLITFTLTSPKTYKVTFSDVDALVANGTLFHHPNIETEGGWSQVWAGFTTLVSSISEQLRLARELDTFMRGDRGTDTHEDSTSVVKNILPPMKVFISHSSHDKELAAAFVELVQSAFALRPRDIRCTSVDGYRLKPGDDFNKVLQTEAVRASSFVGLLTPNSIRSSYVLFELGARWGSGKSFIPILAHGTRPGDIGGPLPHVVDGASEAQIDDVLDLLEAELGQSLVQRSSYRRKLDAFCELCATVEDTLDGEDDVYEDELYKKEGLTREQSEQHEVLEFLAKHVKGEPRGVVQLPEIWSELSHSMSAIRVSMRVRQLVDKGIISCIDQPHPNPSELDMQVAEMTGEPTKIRLYILSRVGWDYVLEHGLDS